MHTYFFIYRQVFQYKSDHNPNGRNLTIVSTPDVSATWRYLCSPIVKIIKNKKKIKHKILSSEIRDVHEVHNSRGRGPKVPKKGITCGLSTRTVTVVVMSLRFKPERRRCGGGLGKGLYRGQSRYNDFTVGKKIISQALLFRRRESRTPISDRSYDVCGPSLWRPS